MKTNPPNLSSSVFPADEPDGPFKAIVPNGVARAIGRNPQAGDGLKEEASGAGKSGWRGNRTGE